MTILEKILKQKEKEVAQLVKQTFEQPAAKKVPLLKDTIRKASNLKVIAEIKRSSPSKGAIHMEVDPIEQAIQYEKQGAAAISVLTDNTFFNGSIKDLQAIRKAVKLPILCKDFIIDRIQIDQARAAGANIILLIAAALSDKELHSLYQYARKQDLEVLCEVHNETEMERVLKLKPEIIGINNRNLKTFEVDLQTTARLASMVTDENTVLISESGMQTKQDALFVSEAGAEAILVGETLMRSKHLPDTFNQLQVPKQKTGAEENAR
ncbi:indole-3-glycerol phosphate synthase TrpC [Virgibacillus halodenitrificans]|uniref:indole-3-glycerol phosphate synthase TrpC n=1 Tax=Virgibacillus halodenitrificans TaxID=1482 RepID=UPI001EED877F|nr:indole-3-glycerol phosphate synthase TrpC [Virgibacillus halodenitrificans]MCG1027409.1 indole-3-glycerol phosphate synthase TrpC [Virgibacillus halodenitrificans]